ncbi:MAG: hypothetical protein HYW57_02460 [Ignavibacteriales bacterium]|nr:hypothetical protein [Ignavibacteriales bacterium]
MVALFVLATILTFVLIDFFVQRSTIQADDLPFQLSQQRSAPGDDTLEAMEKVYIESILSRTGWNITRSAKVLNIDRVTLYNKIAKFGLKRP